MTTRRFVLVAGLWSLGWLLTACRDRPRTISYADGVEIDREDDSKPPYRAIGWRRTDGGSTVCPLTLAHTGQTFGPADWADPSVLKRRGWDDLVADAEEQNYLTPGLKRYKYACGRAAFATAYDSTGRMLWLYVRLGSAAPYEPLTVEWHGAVLILPATGPDVRRVFGEGR